MHFTDLFIRRPVFATVLSLIVLLVGLRAFMSMPTREFPNIEASVINVQTAYPGAGAKLMEGFVTTPMENSLSGIDGIDFINSASTQGQSSITIQFKLGYDVNKAIADVSNAVASARWQLPKDINDPIITKEDPSANPSIYIAFTSKTMTPEAISDYITRVVQPQMGTLSGVSQAKILGPRQYAMRVWLDPNKMASHNITATDVIQGLTNSNVQAAPGSLRSANQKIDVNAKTDITSAQQFNNLVISNQNNYLVRLSDVGHAELGAYDTTTSVNINGDTKAVVVGVIPQSTANPLEISREINNVLPKIIASAPPELQIHVIWDWSKFIAQSLKEVRHTILDATIMVVIVIFLFLGSIRTTFIPIVTIPLSVIGVCSLMSALGYSVNILTMLAWVLAIGLVVDDAIVVVENIHRHIENGEKPLDAAILGAREIGFAVIAMTLTLAAVYAPIGFLTDLTGQLFREFAFTLAGAVLVSGFVALTLSPMMCSKFLNAEIDKKGFVAKIEEIFHWLMEKYRIYLIKALDNRKRVLIVAAVIYALCIILFMTLHRELAPDEDQGVVIAFVTGPSSANIGYTQQYTQQLESIYKTVPEMEGYGILNGIPNGENSAISFLVLKPWEKRSRSVSEIIGSLFPSFWGIAGIKAFPMNIPPLPGTNFGMPVGFVLKTTGSYEDLNNGIQKLIATANKENPRLANLDSDLKLDKPLADISIDRNKASVLGVSMMDISTALNTLLGQPTSSRFEMNGRSYYVIPQLYAQFMNNSQQLDNINVRTASGNLMPISNLVTIKEIASPQSLNHFQQMRSATLSAALAPGYTMGQALDYLRNLASTLPGNIQVDYSNQSRQFIQASGSMEEVFLFAIIFIFLVLAAQFESFRDPLIVMMSVPLSLTGALLAIHLIGGTLNIYTQIGLVTLVGLISKHGILIVEFSNKMQLKGLEMREAVIEASTLRLRPILMTTGAMLFGALPLALASGAGAAARKQLGYVILGGMSFGTLFTLFVIPVVYMYLASRKQKHVEENIQGAP